MNDSSEKPIATTAPHPAGPCVLYADDVRELRVLMQHTLESLGWTVHCVNDGTEAWQEIQRRPHRYDIIITDHHMPNMNGLELVRHLRKHHFAGRIVVISSDLSEDTDLRYQQLDVDVLLKKPVKFTALAALLHELHTARL